MATLLSHHTQWWCSKTLKNLNFALDYVTIWGEKSILVERGSLLMYSEALVHHPVPSSC